MFKLAAMDALEGATTHQELFRRALAQMVKDLNPERAFILYGQDEMGNWETRVSHGLQQGHLVLTSGEISLQPLRRVLDDGEPVMLLDAMSDPEYSDRLSVNLAGIRSVICVPWKDQADMVSGILYADDRAKRSAFLDDNLTWMLRLVEAIRHRIEIIEGRAPETPLPEPDPVPSDEPTDESTTWEDLRSSARRLLKAGKVSKADRKLRLALREAKKHEGADSVAVAKVLRTTANTYRVQNRIEESRELLEEAGEIFAKHGLQLDLARCLNTLANGYFTDGELDKAAELFAKAVEIWQARDAHHKLRAAATSRLGEIDLKSGRPEMAAERYLEAYRLAKAKLGAEDPFTKKARLRAKKARARA